MFVIFLDNKISIGLGLKISKSFDIAKDDKDISFEILLLKAGIDTRILRKNLIFFDYSSYFYT